MATQDYNTTTTAARARTPRSREFQLERASDVLKTIMDRAKDPRNRNTVKASFVKVVFPEKDQTKIDEPRRGWLLHGVDLLFNLNYHSLLRSIPEPGETKRQAISRRAAEKAARAETKAVEIKKFAARVKDAVTEKAKVLVLELAAPNGKKIGDCTCRELISFGSWFAELGAKGKPNQIVRRVVSAEEAYNLAPKSLV